MSKLLKLILTISITTTLFFPFNQAKAQDSYWTIPSFKTNIQIQTDGSMIVTESITADFDNVAHHGIIRNIPVDYQDQYYQNRKLRFSLLSVTNENNQPLANSINKNGRYEVIKIGSATKTVKGKNTYNIIYKVDGALNTLSDHTEIYWNSTGNEWDVPIEKAETKITLPTNPGPNSYSNGTCYTGYDGETKKDCTFNISGPTASFGTTASLKPKQGLTVVYGFPTDIAKTSTIKQIFFFLTDNIGYLIPLLTAGLLYYLWKTKGKDPKVTKDTIMPYYEAPDQLSPCEVGTIIDESVDVEDITSTIIDLAVRGYIKITELNAATLFKKADYTFDRLNKEKEVNLKHHEKLVLKGIFGEDKTTKKLSELNESFYSTIPLVQNEVYSKLVGKKYFPTNPATVVTLYQGIGSAICAAYVFAGGLFFNLIPNLSINIGIIISGILIFLVAKVMPVKTVKGVETYYKILGLKEFINTAEKDRLKWQEQENIFEKLLPYAMVLGIADKWTNAFQDIYKKPPTWFQSSDPNFLSNYNTLLLLNHLNSLNTQARYNLTSTPQRSGSSAWGGGSGFSGGSSGGGFGGGGGSSW